MKDKTRAICLVVVCVATALSAWAISRTALFGVDNREFKVALVKSAVPFPEVTAVELLDADLKIIVDKLAASEAWFQQLDSCYIHVQRTLTLSPDGLQRRKAELKAQFPDCDISAKKFPELTPVVRTTTWTAFDQDRYANQEESDHGALSHVVWDGELLQGRNRYAGQDETYFLKSVPDLVSFSNLPHMFNLSRPGLSSEPHSFAESRIECRARCIYRDRECLVLRESNSNTYWIVSVRKHRVLARFDNMRLWEFDSFKPAGNDVDWPHLWTIKTFMKGKLDSTFQLEADEVKFNQAIDPQRYRVEYQPGVKVCDFRHGIAVYPYDPNRTEEEFAKIRADAEATEKRDSDHEQKIQSKLIGSSAPKFGDGRWLNTDVALEVANLKGKSITIGFLAVNCAPCENLLSQFKQTPQGSGEQRILVFVGTDSDKKIRKKLAPWKLTTPVFVPEPSDQSPRGSIFERYFVQAYPTIVRIDPQGNIVSHQTGMLSDK